MTRENHRLLELLGLNARQVVVSQDGAEVEPPERDTPQLETDRTSSPESKIAFFQTLFVGRGDVYALRWESARTGKYGWSPAVLGGAVNVRSPDKELLPLTPSVIGDHLAGKIHAGLYPLLPDDTCRLVVCDFDGPSWTLDALAYVSAARAMGITPALERSRSGDGAHVWVFFRDNVTATLARRLGTVVLREAMKRYEGKLCLTS